MYLVTFYQCAVTGIPAETYQTKRAACRAASDFVSSFGRVPGHKRDGNVRRDGYTRLIDGSGATEVCADIGIIRQ